MIRQSLTLLLLFALAAASLGADEKPIRVLYVQVKHGDDKGTIMLELLAKVGGLEVKVETDLAKLEELKKETTDVLVFYGGPKSSEAVDRAIEKFVDEGGGVLALHHASAFGSKSWFTMLGARFAGHPAITELTVLITNDKHPITVGIKEFKITDEPYKHNVADVKREVLCRFKDRPNDKDPKAAMANMDIVWTRELGKGRVVYCALGHGKTAWLHPAWQKLVAQSICWLAGKPREVHLDVGN